MIVFDRDQGDAGDIFRSVRSQLSMIPVSLGMEKPIRVTSRIQAMEMGPPAVPEGE